MNHKYRQVVKQGRIIDTHHTVAPLGAQVSDSITPRTSCRLSPPAGPTHELNAPNGRARAELVATTHRTTQPVEAAQAVASRAIRLLPTPAAPLTTIPLQSRSDNAASMSRISFDRPVSGHPNRM